MLTRSASGHEVLFLTRNHTELPGVEWFAAKLIIATTRALCSQEQSPWLRHVEMVILTGGLGSTEDDVKRRDAVARRNGTRRRVRQIHQRRD